MLSTIRSIGALRLGINPRATLIVVLAIAFAFSIALSAAACGPDSGTITTPTPDLSTADSIDIVYSLMPSVREGDRLSPLFGDIPEDRDAIERLALAIDSAVVTGGSPRLLVDERGRHLIVMLREGESVIVRQILKCDAQPEIARMTPASAGCTGRYLPLADTWWVEGRGIVKSPDLGLWWEDMPSFMAPIGSISLPETIDAGQPFSLTICCWANILQTPTMDLSLVSQDGNEIALGQLPTERDSAEAQFTVPDHTPQDRYWLRVSTNGFSELVEVVQVQ